MYVYIIENVTYNHTDQTKQLYDKVLGIKLILKKTHHNWVIASRQKCCWTYQETDFKQSGISRFFRYRKTISV